MWSECSWVMRIAASDCGSSPSDFIRLNVSRQEMPASTKILVRVLATNAQFPRLPLASIEIVTHMLRRIRASPVDWGVTFWLSDTWDEPGVRRLGRIRNWKEQLVTGGFPLPSNWHNHILHNLAQHLIRLLGFLQRRGIASVDHHAMGKDRHGKWLEVFRNTEAAAVEERHGLGCAIERLRPARRNSQ